MYIGIGVLAGAFIWVGLRRRGNRRFREENKAREALGLPELTRSQFEMTVVEKSEDFRSNVNFHM